jgi:hypothetical protein
MALFLGADDIDLCLRVDVSEGKPQGEAVHLGFG